MNLTPAEAKALAGPREELTKDLLIQHLRAELHKANEQIKAAAPVLADKIEQLEGVMAAQEIRIQELRREIAGFKHTKNKLKKVEAIFADIALVLEYKCEPEELGVPDYADDDE